MDEPNEAILSQESALKYFGKEDAIGEVFSFDSRDFKVTAIMEDCPNNTDLPFDVMLSFSTIKKEKDEVLYMKLINSGLHINSLSDTFILMVA